MKHQKQLFLSRRNLESLLSKLDRVKTGDISYCSIIKFRNEKDAEYMSNIDNVMVTAVEDHVYYVNRGAGAILPVDVKEVRHNTGEVSSSCMLKL